MSIPDYVQQVAREAAPIIKGDTDHALQNEETSHFFTSLSFALTSISHFCAVIKGA